LPAVSVLIQEKIKKLKNLPRTRGHTQYHKKQIIPRLSLCPLHSIFRGIRLCYLYILLYSVSFTKGAERRGGREAEERGEEGEVGYLQAQFGKVPGGGSFINKGGHFSNSLYLSIC
jgi:hypothetical protein